MILEKYGENSYKVELPLDLSISSIFNVQDMLAYKEDLPLVILYVHNDLEPTVAPTNSKLEVEEVLESRVKKSTSHKVYMENLIKWKGKPTSEASWLA